MRLPEGASLNRTGAAVEQAEDVIKSVPGVSGVLSVVGFDFLDGVTSPNQAFFVIQLAPYGQRGEASRSASAIVAALRPKLAAINQAVAFPFNLPPILGLGSTGGFQYMLEALQGQKPSDIAAVSRAVLVAANSQPELGGRVHHLRRRHAAGLSRLYRNKAQVLGVAVSDIFAALAGDDRAALCQPVQPVRPRLAGQPAGRRALSQARSTTFSMSTRAPQAARWCRSACSANPTSSRGRTC